MGPLIPTSLLQNLDPELTLDVWLFPSLKYHLYCLPLVKFEQDRQALLAVVNDQQNTRFFAGTDSAPHTTKATDCGCAAGCFTGGIAPQLYAQCFDLKEGHRKLEAFLCRNGAAFYDLPVPNETFTLIKEPQDVRPLTTEDGTVLPLPLGLGQTSLPWKIVL